MTTTTTTATRPDSALHPVVGRLLDAIRDATVTDELFAADAVLDATVPGWRFSVTGGAGVAEQLRTWFDDPSQFEELLRHPTPSGEVVEYTLSSAHAGVPYAVRHVHVLTVEEDRIVADHVWCAGRWDAARLAEMEVAADERRRRGDA